MCLNIRTVGSGPRKSNSNVLLILSSYSNLVQDCSFEDFGKTYWSHVQGSHSPKGMSETGGCMKM